MLEDPIVEEVRAIRRQRAERFDFNVRAIAEDARSREKTCGHEIVSPPKREKSK